MHACVEGCSVDSASCPPASARAYGRAHRQGGASVESEQPLQKRARIGPAAPLELGPTAQPLTRPAGSPQARRTACGERRVRQFESVRLGGGARVRAARVPHEMAEAREGWGGG
eukprot:872958-Prymnesium_polylepis.1